MTEILINLEQLRGMIGIQLYHNGKPSIVIEVLEDGPSLVIQHLDKNSSPIQSNQYGNAHRRTPETFCIPVLSADKTELSGLFLELDLL